MALCARSFWERAVGLFGGAEGGRGQGVVSLRTISQDVCHWLGSGFCATTPWT